ncbi:MAG: DUF374 domain-containing protein [Gammaproteobacteria bacterium]|nr:DUF374 domain-containing protein [Gammaproteobacteria bacterium]
MNIMKSTAIMAIRLWATTLRFTPTQPPIKQPAIIAFWHSHLLPMWAYFANNDCFALVSKSRDGKKLGALLEKWHYQVIYGSSSKGGIQALQEMITAAKSHRVLLTPDGPRGPRNSMKPGALLAAQFADVPIYLVKPKYCGITLTRTWDRSKIPLPWAKVELAISEPIRVNTDLSDEQINAMITRCEEIFAAL